MRTLIKSYLDSFGLVVFLPVILIAIWLSGGSVYPDFPAYALLLSVATVGAFVLHYTEYEFGERELIVRTIRGEKIAPYPHIRRVYLTLVFFPAFHVPFADLVWCYKAVVTTEEKMVFRFNFFEKGKFIKFTQGLSQYYTGKIVWDEIFEEFPLKKMKTIFVQSTKEEIEKMIKEDRTANKGSRKKNSL